MRNDVRTPLANRGTRARHFAASLWSTWHPRYVLAHALAHLVPRFGGRGLVAGLYRHIGGLSIGEGSIFGGPLVLRTGLPPAGRLQIGRNVVVSTDVTINLDGRVDIGDNCAIGPFVRIYTGTHGLGPGSRRMLPLLSPKPVTIARGSWVGLGATVLPGVTIGEGSVVAAGSVVTDDVPPHSYAAGNPAVVVRSLPWSDR